MILKGYQIYERSLNRIEGLARLLVLEKLANPQARTSYLESRRALRGRPNNEQRSVRRNRRRRKYKNDLKAEDEISGLEMNSYDSFSLHIPYGPGWNARRIAKLIYTAVSLSFDTLNCCKPYPGSRTSRI